MTLHDFQPFTNSFNVVEPGLSDLHNKTSPLTNQNYHKYLESHGKVIIINIIRIHKLNSLMEMLILYF